MNEIIPISKQNFSGSEQNAVNARELHGFLEVQSRFNDWIVRRIRDFDFIENQDFVTLTQNLVSGGKQIDYFLSLDMAKELSMVERNDKGNKVRLTPKVTGKGQVYFINKFQKMAAVA